MKKWKCPECEVLTDIVSANVEGNCTIDVNHNVELDEWECGSSQCEECGFEESQWDERNKFEVVEVEDD